MFGMGFGEIVLIVIVALLFIGPEKLPQAAKTLSKGIRDVRKQTRELRETIEDDAEIGGAIRDLQSALQGDEFQPAAAARRTLLTHKAGAPKPSSESLAPGAGEGAALPSGTGAGTAASATEPAAGDGAGDAAASAAEPVLATPAGAISRGGAGDAPAPAAGAGAPAGDARGSTEEQEPAASPQSASGHAHG